MMRHDLRKQKQKLIAENLPMTESEAIKFWAVYQKYSDDFSSCRSLLFLASSFGLLPCDWSHRFIVASFTARTVGVSNTSTTI